MALSRTTGVLAGVMLLVGSMVAAAASAQAATSISPPTITAPLGGLGPYPVGTPVTFTFSEEGAGTAVAYEYTLNGGPTERASAPSGVASVATAYLISGLSMTATAKVIAGMPQKLS